MKRCLVVIFLSLANVGCASERLYVKVVDDEGNPVELPYCDFIRIQTAVDEVYSMIGELSTEVSGMEIMNKQ